MEEHSTNVARVSVDGDGDGGINSHRLQTKKSKTAPTEVVEKPQKGRGGGATMTTPTGTTTTAKRQKNTKDTSIFPPVWRVYQQADQVNKNMFDDHADADGANHDDDTGLLSDRACQLWSSPLGAHYASLHRRPAGVCRKLGVINLEFVWNRHQGKGGNSNNKKKKTVKKKESLSSSTNDGEMEWIHSQVEDKARFQPQAKTNCRKAVEAPSKAQAKKDAVNFFLVQRHDESRSDKPIKSGTKTTATNSGKKQKKDINYDKKCNAIIADIQRDWKGIVEAGPIVPQWHSTTGQPMLFGGTTTTTTSAGRGGFTSCTKLLNLMQKKKLLVDPHPNKVRSLYNGLQQIPVDAKSVLDALVELSTPSKELYDMPLLIVIPKIHDIQMMTTTSDGNPKVSISIACYANRLLFEVMTQRLQIVFAAMDPDTVQVTQDLSAPPSIAQNAEPVFDSDPDGPTVVFDSENHGSSEDNEETKDGKEFDEVTASDGKLDAYTPQGFLKWIENHGVCMDDWNKVESLLEGKLNVDLMLHQKHGVAFMYKMEDLVNGINSLIWEERAFPEGDRYWYSPALGQLRLGLGNGKKDGVVRGGIIADEMGLGKTCSALALVLATLPEVKLEASKRDSSSSSATLVVVPPALLNQWVTEVKKVSLDLVVDFFDHKSLQFLRRTDHSPENDADIILTTYQAFEDPKKGYAGSSSQILGSTHWARVVLDEMQEIRSSTTNIAKNCNALLAERRWMLSGTPLFDGIKDFRGELCFLKLDPFAADNEDGFFEFAVASHWDARSRYGLATLRVLSLIMLRRSKSMIIRKTNLPLLGLKPMTVTFQPISQSSSERAIYCFLEHLMHTVLGRETIDQREKKRKDRHSFLRILREICISPHLLNGGLGCQSQLDILNRWMQAYNRTKQPAAGGRSDRSLSIEEAIQFISQAHSATRTRTDFVSDLVMGGGGGAANRIRAVQSGTKAEDRLHDRQEKLRLTQNALASDRNRRAKARWLWAVEAITTGELQCYGSVRNIFVRLLWQGRRSSKSRGWRPTRAFFGHGSTIESTARDEAAILRLLYEEHCFKWAHPFAILLSHIPSEVNLHDVTSSLKGCVRRSKLREGHKYGEVHLFPAGPRPGAPSWNTICHFESREEVDVVLDAASKSQGIELKSTAVIPWISDRIAQAKRRLDQAEAHDFVHPSVENSSKLRAALTEYKQAKAGLRASLHYEHGRVLLSKGFEGFRSSVNDSFEKELEMEIHDLTDSINEHARILKSLEIEMTQLTSEITNTLSGKAKATTAVEALEALKNGKAEETHCPFCQYELGSADVSGQVAAAPCGHLSCLHCLQDYKEKRSKAGQCFTCVECRKQIVDYVRIDPKKQDDTEQKRNDAKSLVQEAASKLKTNESGQLEPHLWEALYFSIDLPSHENLPSRGRFTALPIDVLCHLQEATGILTNLNDRQVAKLHSNVLSSKVQALLKDLPRDEISVVFASSNSTVKHLMFVLFQNGIGCRGLFVGQTEDEAKEAIDQWQNDQSVLVLVVQAGAAACGLTLTASSRMFLMSPFLKYEEEQQAYARLHRYGQKKEVACTVYYTPVSVESRLLAWRKQSNQFVPNDEKMTFASLHYEDDTDDVDMVQSWKDEDELSDNDEKDEEGDEENQTQFLLNLQI